MGAIKREPTPPGPVTHLLNRLHQIHLIAGQPSIREIAGKVGRGVISSSTIHNMFRGPRVPRWGFLELVVEALGGDVEEFRELWQVARLAEDKNAVGAGAPPMAAVAPVTSRPAASLPEPAAPEGAAQEKAAPEKVTAVSGTAERIWSNEIPQRNRHFTGRVTELDALRSNLVRADRPHHPAQLISGMGGVGKTELATEYIHRHRDKYDIIWWIRAEHHDRVRDALVKLGLRLQVRPAGTESGRDRTIAAVLDALASGVRPSWLLVYDNAAQPLDLQRYLPNCPSGGHILITSRLQNWPGYIEKDSVAVVPFTAEESTSFLRRRVPALGADRRLPAREDERRAGEAVRLAEALGHLPIAVEHAAAYLTETGHSVDDYLTRFAENADRLLSEEVPDSPVSVSATWALSTELLTEDAQHLFNLCAFFSPEPIAVQLFLEHAAAVGEPHGLREFLSSPPRIRAAAIQMHRLSLVKVDGARDQIQMHRVVQFVTRARLRQNRPVAFLAYRAAVDILLAESNPHNPDRGSNDAVYDLSLQHLESEHNFLNTANPALRRLVVDQVRRLHLRGGHVEAIRFGQDALKVWRERLGEYDLDVLALAVELAIAMQMNGHAADARRLIFQTRALLGEHYGDQHMVTLLCDNLYGEDLRTRGQFNEALELDRGLLPKFEEAFGLDHQRTLNVRNNIASDFRRLGHFREALDIDQRTYEDRRRILGDSDPRTLNSQDMVAVDLRGLGRYQESLDIARRVAAAFAAAGGRETPDWLNARTGFAAALRKAGYHWDALQESEEVVQRYRDYLGVDHAHTLRAAANLINDRRAVGELTVAERLGLEICERSRAAGSPVEILYAAMVNLASVLRVAGRPEDALRHDLQAREALVVIYGDQHPFTLAASINYATDLAWCGELGEAIRTGQDTLADCRASLGPDHPDTLMAAVNLAIDVGRSGNQARAERLLDDALDRYAATLTTEHPEAQAASRGERLTAEIEPYSY
ncbi:MAG TPA: FxSxx-COOH system tetratricopeptide repeat protein [Trebonia sp.]|nr:FxSxx-COOH system tetratricopeptide repeat protein [Trebonia sp.]